MRFIPASEITTTEGKSNVNNISNCSTLFDFYIINFSQSFIIIVRFILAPEITTTEGKTNVNSI